MVVSIAHVIAGTPATGTVQISTNATFLHAIPTQLAPTMKAPTVAVANQDSVEMEIAVLTLMNALDPPVMQTQHASTMKELTVAVVTLDYLEMEIPVLTSTSVIITPAT